MSKDKSLEKVMKGAGFVFVGMLLAKLLNYIFRVVVSRYYGAADYGLFSLGLAVVGIIATLSLLGLPQGIVRYVSQFRASRDREGINRVISSSLKITVPLSLVLFLLIYFLSDFLAGSVFSKPELGSLLRILSFSIPLLVLLANFEKLVLAFQKVEYTVLARSLVENLLKVLLVILFLFWGLSVEWVAMAYVFSLAIALLLLYYFLKKKVYSLKGVFSRKFKIMPSLVKFSLPLFVSDVFAYLLVWTDTLVIGYFLSAVDVGIYNVAAPTAMLVYVIPTTIKTMFYPVMSERYSSGNYAKFFKRMGDWVLFLTLPVASFLVLFAEEFILLFFGTEFVSGTSVLIIICLAYFIYSLFMTSHIMLYVMKKTKLVLFNTVLSVILNIILNIVMIPKYGILGAALATGIALLVRALLIFGEVWWFTKVLPVSLRNILALFAVLIVSGFAYLVKSSVDSIWLLVISSLVFGVVYLLLLLLLGYFNREYFFFYYIIVNKLPFNLGLFRRFIY